MSRGWQELRVGADGRWDPTGQLRDQFPYAAPSGEMNAPGSVPFHMAAVVDTLNAVRNVAIPGDPPVDGYPIGALGWAQFTRP